MIEPIPGETLDPDNPPIPGWEDAPVSGGRVDLHEGPLIAGTPGGARVEIREDGLHAYDGTGTETATIQGEGGEFVGGSFRTSDALPGQVVISDTAHQGTPGMSIEPDDPTGYDVLPSIGPGPADMWISGGVATDGTRSGANFNATGTSIYHNGPGASGAGAWSAVNSSGVEMRYRADRSQLTPQSLIRAYDGSAQVVADGGEGTFSIIGASADNARVVTARPDGLSAVYTTDEFAELEYRTGTFSRKLRVDATGVWVETGSEAYNLEQLAKDTGRTEFPTVAGVTRVVAPTWRNKANMILFNGTVSKAWTVGWNSVAVGMPLVTRPDIEEVRNAPIPEPGYLIRITPGGGLDVYAPTAGARDVRLSGLTYPLG